MCVHTAFLVSYGNPKFWDSWSGIVASCKGIVIIEEAPPGVEPVAQFDSTQRNLPRVAVCFHRAGGTHQVSLQMWKHMQRVFSLMKNESY